MADHTITQVALRYEANDWCQYQMDWRRPHRQLEPPAREIEVVDEALTALVGAGILAHASYDRQKMLAHRVAVRERFEIPWTAISPRMERLLYAINAIAQPRALVAVGVFCGNTFIANAGAAIGPGASYDAERLVGIEIRPAEAARARRNVSAIDAQGLAEVIVADGIPWLRDFDGVIDLLYLDADSPITATKSIYQELLDASWHALRPGSLILAHNAVNAADQMPDYLARVRDPGSFQRSMTMIVDDQGLEVTLR